jgi:short-subunit dehydrogenase
METKGANILITGANRGIGKAVAKRLAEDGAHLYLAMRKNDDTLTNDLKKAGAKDVEIIEADLSTREGVEKLAQKMSTIKIDILFNNAGLLSGGLLENQPLDDIYALLQVNVNALIHLSHAVLPQMLKRKKGLIINHSSVAAIMQAPCASTYSASKAAVLAFTNCLRQELKNTGVKTLVLITPGIKTRMFDNIEPLYGKNIEIPKDTISPEKYAEMIREAIVEDLEVLNPSGLTGAALQIARYLPAVFEKAVSFRFKR